MYETPGPLHEPLTGRSWDRGAVEREVGARAARYRALEIERGARVFLGFGNRLELFVDLLALWRLGACAVPLETRATDHELGNLVAAARPTAYLACDELGAATTAVLDAAGVAIVRSDGAPAGDDGGAPAVAAELDDDALILFTSGTTGQPKGVVHSHRSLRGQWRALRASLGLEPFARTLCLLPTHFGHGLICNSLFPWLMGSDLFVLPPFRPDVLFALGRLIDDHQITFLSSVPTVWRLTLPAARPPERSSLLQVHCGSAPLSAHLWRQIQDWCGTERVINAYGITETASWMAGSADSHLEPADGLIGHGWGAELRVLRGGSIAAPPGVGADCEPGETGHIWVRSAGLMSGYLERPDLTEQVMRDGWFVTGDLGCLDGEGRLWLRGRLREEINKGGLKVQPADVDAAFEPHPAVRDACCFGYPDELYGQQIGVALVVDPADGATLRALYAHAKARLGDHRLPVRWHLLDSIPRTSRGKVDRSAVERHCAALEALDLRRLHGPPS